MNEDEKEVLKTFLGPDEKCTECGHDASFHDTDNYGEWFCTAKDDNGYHCQCGCNTGR